MLVVSESFHSLWHVTAIRTPHEIVFCYFSSAGFFSGIVSGDIVGTGRRDDKTRFGSGD